MMSWIQRWAAHCEGCGHEWLASDPEVRGDPKQCAKCKTRHWNDSMKGGNSGKREAEVLPGVSGVEVGKGRVKRAQRASSGAQSESCGVDGGMEEDTGREGAAEGEGKGFRAGEFLKMPLSEQLKRMREGK